MEGNFRDWKGSISLMLLAFGSSAYGLFVYSREVSVTLSDVILLIVIVFNFLTALTRLRLRILLRLQRPFFWVVLGLGLVLVGQLVSLVSNARQYTLGLALFRGSLLFGLLLIARGALVLVSLIVVYRAVTKDGGNVLISVKSFVGVLVVSVLWSVLESYILGFRSAPVALANELVYRIRGFQPEPSMFGPPLAAGFFACFGLALDYRGRNWPWLLCLLVLAVGFVLSYSTLSVLSGLAGAIAFGTGLIGTKRATLISYSILLSAVLFLLLSLSIPLLTPASMDNIVSFAARPIERIVDPEDYSVRYRLGALAAGMKVLAGNWLVGVGPGRLGVVLDDFSAGPLQASYALTMNSYINLLAESGVVAGLGVLILWFTILRLYSSAIRLGQREAQVLPLGLVAGSIVGLVSWSGVDNYLHFYTWLLLGMAAGWKGYPRHLSPP